jgi:hypothetical protein
MYLRMILWTLALAYAGFLLTGGKNVSSPSMMITTAFLGALLGFLLAIMFTLREHRRETRAGHHWPSRLIPRH